MGTCFESRLGQRFPAWYRSNDWAIEETNFCLGSSLKLGRRGMELLRKLLPNMTSMNKTRTSRLVGLTFEDLVVLVLNLDLN